MSSSVKVTWTAKPCKLRTILAGNLSFRRTGSICESFVRLGDGELVLSTKLDPETDILVESVDHAVAVFKKAGGKTITPPENVAVGRAAVVEDPFGNKLTLVDLSKRRLD